MIRTALLAGIFLVLLSIAFTRSGPALLPMLKEEAVSAKAAPVEPVKHVQAPEPAPIREPVRKVDAPVAPPVAEPAPQVAVAPAAPAVVETPPAPAPAPVMAQEAPKTAGQPVSLLPPEKQHPQTAAAPVAPPAITPAAEMPTIAVAARPAVAPYDVPSGSAHVAVADPSAKPADAPKLMTPQERSKELYRLAREMEDTFIHKLAR